MERRAAIIGILLFLSCAAVSYGHGTPIHVEVIADRLVASGGQADTAGYAPMIFLEDDADGDPFATTTLPLVGPVIIWQLPGFEIVGMDDQSSLSIEILTRPANNTNPVDERILWYWNPATETVEPTASPFYLLGTGMRFATLDPSASVAPDPFVLADPIAGHQGRHNHDLLSYALDNGPPPEAGVYGFFARLTSDSELPSNPFLMVFNLDTDYEQMTPAGLAINAAAFLPGDYNHDDHVDAADYVLWRETLGSSTALAADGSGNMLVDDADFGVWRTNFGRTFAGLSGGANVSLASLPEPTSLAMGAAMCWISMLRRRQRTKSVIAAQLIGYQSVDTTFGGSYHTSAIAGGASL